MKKIPIAILDDYQHVALRYADWTAIQEKAEITVFNDHLSTTDEIVRKLRDFTIICVMRERTPLGFEELSRLPNLKLIVSTGKRNASIDTKATATLGIELAHTGYLDTGAPELTWGLLLAIARHIPQEAQNVRNNQWQQTVGTDLAGRTLGIVGLGRIGTRIARYAKAFEMKVLAWSPNLTEERAHRAGAELVSKEQLFKNADFVTLHLVLSDRTRHIITANDLAAMKRTAYLINTARSPLVDEQALLATLKQKQIAGAALDVFDTEPLPLYHELRKSPNVLATPHIGYVTENTYQLFYRDTVKIIENWLTENP